MHAWRQGSWIFIESVKNNGKIFCLVLRVEVYTVVNVWSEAPSSAVQYIDAQYVKGACCRYVWVGGERWRTHYPEILTAYRTAWHHSPEYWNHLCCKMRPVFRSILSLEVCDCQIHKENTSVNEIYMSPNAKGSPFMYSTWDRIRLDLVSIGRSVHVCCVASK